MTGTIGIPVVGGGGGGFGASRGEGSKTDDAAKDKKEVIPPFMKWKARAKLVAYVDIVFSCVVIGFCASFFTMVCVHLITLGDPCWQWTTSEQIVKAFLGGLGIILVAGIVGRCISIWTAIKLLQAAFSAQDRKAAEEMTWLWRAFTIVGSFICPVTLAVCGVILYYFTLPTHYLTLLFSSMTVVVYDFVWRIVSNYAVTRFLQSFENGGGDGHDGERDGKVDIEA